MRYIATGVVLPERAAVRFDTITASIPDKGTITASCDASQLFVSVDIADLDGYVAAKLVAEQFAHVVVSALGFSLGCHYSVEIVQVVEEPPAAHVFGVNVENLTYHPHEPMFVRAYLLASEDLFFRLALRDYTRAITEAVDCPTYCFRAIEALKSGFAFRGAADGWTAMHAALGTDRDTIENTVKRYADPIRHGNWIAAASTTSATRNAMLVLTRQILEGYMNHVRPAA